MVRVVIDSAVICELDIGYSSVLDCDGDDII